MKVKIYEMEMIFELTLGLKTVDKFMSQMGVSDTLAAKGTELTIKQTVPFIPTEDYIHKIENVIKEHYSKEDVYVMDCNFKGYKKLLEKEIDEKDV